MVSAETLEKQQRISESVVVPSQLVLYTQHYLEGKDLLLGFKLLQIKQEFGSNKQLRAYCQP